MPRRFLECVRGNQFTTTRTIVRFHMSFRPACGRETLLRSSSRRSGIDIRPCSERRRAGTRLSSGGQGSSGWRRFFAICNVNWREPLFRPTMATIYPGSATKKALQFLEKPCQARALELSSSLKADFRIDSLRSDSRFQNWLRRVVLANWKSSIRHRVNAREGRRAHGEWVAICVNVRR